jgi:PAS domain S-box-containing protein
LLAETQHAAKMGGWEYSYGTRELAWTDETFRIFETTRADFPLSWEAMLSRFTPESRQGFLDACASLEQTDGALDLELEINTLRNQRLWVRVLGHVEWQDGKPLRSFGSVQNVQAQKRAQVALETSTGWLKLSMAMAHMLAWRWDRAGDKLEFAEIERASGHLPRVFPGMKRLLARIHPKDRLAVRRAIDQAFERHAEVRVEFRLRAADGEYRWFAAIARPRFDTANQPSGLVGVVQDVTARHQAEHRLRRSEELLRATTANTADSLLLLDTDLVIQFINREAYGMSIEQIIGRHISAVLPSYRQRPVSEILRRVLLTGENVSYEFDRMADGTETQFYECRAVLVRDDGVVTGISMTVRNITERKRMEQEILDVATRERQTIGRDLHDGLGQELTGVALMLRGLAKRIQQQCPESVDQVNEIVQSVNQSIDTARALARGLLPLQTERGGLSRALHELAARGRSLYGFEVDLEVDIAPAVHLSEAHASHLYRIVQEALTNAARHARASRVRIALSASPQRMLLHITDDGVGLGMSRRAAPGMGLKIMKYRASMIGAKCEIGPNQPHGTVIRITGEQTPAAGVPQSVQSTQESG